MQATRQTPMKPTAKGYVKQIGTKGDSQKFYLGKDRQQALDRLKAILTLFEETSRGNGGKWTPNALEQARAIAKGQQEKVRLEPATLIPLPIPGEKIMVKALHGMESPDQYFARVNAAGALPAHEGWYEAGRAAIVRDLNHAQSQLSTTPGKKAVGQMLFAALDAYSVYIRQESTIGNVLSDNGKSKLDLHKSFKSYLPNMDLGELDQEAVDKLFGIYRNRPMRKVGKIMAYKSCVNAIGELDRCLRWIHLSKDWAWRKPEDYDGIKKTPRLLDEDVEKEAAEVAVWTLDELKTLYKYAHPQERLLILLGLNCAYGADQTGRLKKSHIKFGEKYSFLNRVRRKKRVRGIHLLWQETVKGLQWQLKQAGEEYVFVTKGNIPFWSLTPGGNRRQTIPNIWTRLIKRIRIDHPDFRHLPFNSLRDTSATLMNKIAGENTASLHITHKHQSKDANLKSYANPNRKRHFRALLKLEKHLACIWEGVDSFAPTKVCKIGLAKVEEIKRLHGQGVAINEIAAKVGVSHMTVRDWVKGL